MKYLFLFLMTLIALLSFDGCKPSTNAGTFSVLQRNRDGHPLFATVDSSLRDKKARTGFAWFLSVSTQLKDPTTDGLTTNQEASELNDWEDLLERDYLRDCRFVYVGRVTWNGTRQLLFYLDRPDCAEPTLKKFAHDFPKRVFHFQCQPDEQWEKVSSYFGES
jgi:hypothetical protein